MLRFIRSAVAWLFFIVALVWKALDVLGRSDVFLKMPEFAKHLQDFVLSHQELGYQIAPWVVMVASVLALVLMQWPQLLKLVPERGRKSPAQANVISPPSLLAWRATPEIVATFKALANEHTNVKIAFFDASHFPFAERLAFGFEAAGWSVNFNKTAQGVVNHHYHGGIEVSGHNRYFVENIASTLQKSGCSLVKTQITATNIKTSHPKYEGARNKIWITIGYQE